MFFCRSIGRLLLGIMLLGSAVSAKAAPRVWLADDFFIEVGDAPNVWSELTRPKVTDCRANIERAMCVVKARFEPHGDRASRACDRDSAPYVAFFEAVYDRFPPVLQQVFCSLDKISVEANMESIAYAGLRGSTAIMGFRKSVIDEALDLPTLLSWKEQLPFGGERDSYTLSDKLPLLGVTSGTGAPSQDLAFYILAHEFAHMLDFANDVNTPCWPGMACEAERGTWTALSWADTDHPRKSADFPHRADVCFYQCNRSPVPVKYIASLYEGLRDSNFVTLYASTNVYDDFAESVAFYYLDRERGFTYGVDTRQGATYNLLDKVHAPVFKSKLKYIERFVSRDDLAYP